MRAGATGERLPVTVVASVDAVLRESATAGALCDVPGVVALRYDLGPGRADGLRRTVLDADGVVEDVLVPLEHACLGCALREDVLPTVAAIAASGRWEHALLALPVAAEPAAAVHALEGGEVDGRDVADLVRVHGVLAVVDPAALEAGLFGDDLLVERGLALTEDDSRALGEALAHQLEEADAVVLTAAPDERADALLRHLHRAEPELLRLHEDGAALLRPRRTGSVADGRGDVRAARPTGAADAAGIWTVELSSPLPFHPGRLLERLEELGGGRLRGRGAFWLPARPDAACAWDGAGGQLSIGDVGPWEPGERRTHLVVTGTAEEDPGRVRAVFAELLATPDEAAELAASGADDGFEPWLGATGHCAADGADHDGATRW